MRDLSGWTALHPKSCPSPNPKGPFRMLPALTSPHGGKLLDRNANTALEDFILLQTRHQATLFGGSLHPQPRSSDRARGLPTPLMSPCHPGHLATPRRCQRGRSAVGAVNYGPIFIFYLFILQTTPCLGGAGAQPSSWGGPGLAVLPAAGSEPAPGAPSTPGTPGGRRGRAPSCGERGHRRVT